MIKRLVLSVAILLAWLPTTAPAFAQAVAIQGVPDIVSTGTITTTDVVVAAPGGTGVLVSGASTAGSLVAVSTAGSASSWIVQITGMTSGTLYFEISTDSTNGTNGNWISVNGRDTGVVVGSLITNNAAANGVYRGNVSGARWWRIRSAGALVGTPAIVIRVGAGTGAVFLNSAIPAGSNTIGGVTTAPSSSATAGIVPGVSGSASSGLVLKAAAGNLYSAYAVCTAACWLMVFNSATIPADGATTAGVASGNLQDCVPIASGGTGGVTYAIPEVFSAGISAAISSTACATKTAATTGFIHGQIQ